VLEDNADLRARLTGYNISPKEFTVIKTADGVELNSWMIKPTNFDPNKKYPLLMFVYGPGSQQVLNQYDGANFYWYQILAQKGYIVACVDNRGTGGRGSEFKKCTYLNLGKLEVHDQIEAANILVNFHLSMPLVLVFKDGRMVVLWHQIVYFKVLTFSRLLLLLLL
jgi:dipeptidyl-peptidase-4